MPKEFAHLDAKRRREKPTAIGRMPPDFLFMARRRPPKKIGATSEGHIISIIIIIIIVVVVIIKVTFTARNSENRNKYAWSAVAWREMSLTALDEECREKCHMIAVKPVYNALETTAITTDCIAQYSASYGRQHMQESQSYIFSVRSALSSRYGR